MSTLTGACIGLLAGSGIGGVVTRRLHRRTQGWGARLGRTRFRYANLPVGGVLALAAAAAAPASAAPVLLAASTAMAATAIGWRYVDPLPVLLGAGDERRLADMRSMISQATDEGLLEGRAEWAAAPIAPDLRAAILRIADDEIARRGLPPA